MIDLADATRLVGVNHPLGLRVAQVLANAKSGRRVVGVEPAHGDRLAICGGGPSLDRWLPHLRASGRAVWGLNGAAKWLRNALREPIAAGVVMDARAENERFLRDPSAAQTWFLASQVSPLLVEMADHRAVLWHPMEFRFLTKPLAEAAPGSAFIGGAATVGLYAMCLAHTLGFRDVALYGFDSGSEERVSHVYQQDAGGLIDVIVDGRTFWATPTMAIQAQLLPRFAGALADAKMHIELCSDGLIAEVFA